MIVRVGEADHADATRGGGASDGIELRARRGDARPGVKGPRSEETEEEQEDGWRESRRTREARRAERKAELVAWRKQLDGVEEEPQSGNDAPWRRGRQQQPQQRSGRDSARGRSPRRDGRVKFVEHM